MIINTLIFSLNKIINFKTLYPFQVLSFGDSLYRHSGNLGEVAHNQLELGN